MPLHHCDKDGGDNAPAIGERDAMFNRREQIGLMRENAPNFFRRGESDARNVISSRTNTGNRPDDVHARRH